MKYFLELIYDGTAYSGWQRQPHSVSIQQILEERLSHIFDSPTEVTGCGRTDKGVHARQYFAHVDLKKKPDNNFLFRLNNYLPRDIAVRHIIPAPEEAHARFDALRRTYHYSVHYRKNPFLDQYSFYYQKSAEYPLEILNSFSHTLLDYTDFKPFAKFHSDVRNHRCNLSECKWATTDDGFKLTITSDRFLRGMVRLIAGASLRFAEGKIELSDLEKAMTTGNQIKAAWAVPACGLTLARVEYPYI